MASVRTPILRGLDPFPSLTTHGSPTANHGEPERGPSLQVCVRARWAHQVTRTFHQIFLPPAGPVMEYDGSWGSPNLALTGQIWGISHYTPKTEVP